jgi:hypothetical protein
MISISNAIRTSRVNTDHAQRVQSHRRQNLGASNQITSNTVDQYGRSVHPSTINTARDDGTTCVKHIINLQNTVSRPQYGSHLNVIQGLDGNGSYDTLLYGHLSRSSSMDLGDENEPVYFDDANLELARMSQNRFGRESENDNRY